MVSAHYKRTIYSKAGKYDYYNAKTLRENGKSMKSHSNILIWSLVCLVLRFRSHVMSSRNIVMWLHYYWDVVSFIFDEFLPLCHVTMSLHDEVSTV